MEGDDAEEGRVVGLADVLVVCELANADQLHLRDGAERRRQPRRELPRERLAHELEGAHVVAVDLVRSTEADWDWRRRGGDEATRPIAGQGAGLTGWGVRVAERGETKATNTDGENT